MPENKAPMILDGHMLPAGKRSRVRLNVAALPSGTQVDINAHIFRAKKPGPCVLLLGGLHGDEINGVEIVRRLMRSQLQNKLLCGDIICIPLLNVYGFINFSRSVRDGKDVNRSFPGSKKGSLASQVAHMMTHVILPLIDFGVDFHTGGSSIHNHPQLRVSRDDEHAMKLAKAFAPPIILENKPISKSHRLQAMKMGKPILVFEGGESLRLDEASIRMGMEGVERLLVAHGMLNQAPPAPRCKTYQESRWVRAIRAGIVNRNTEAGQRVSKGDILAEIHDLHELKKSVVKSPVDGFVLSHVNNPVVSRGDALFHIVHK